MNNNNNNNNNKFQQQKTNNKLRPRNYMGASFQAPCATPRQRQMEMHHVSLIFLYFSMLL